MHRVMLAMTCALALTLAAGSASAAIDPNGIFWDGHIAAGSPPSVESGRLDIDFDTPTTGTATYYGSTPGTHTILDFQPLGCSYWQVSVQDDGDNIRAFSQNVQMSVDRIADGGQVGLDLSLRKAPGLYADQDMYGTYKYISHGFGNGSSSMQIGQVDMMPGGTLNYAFSDPDGGNIDVGGGIWALNSGSSLLWVEPTGAPSAFPMNLGAGRVLGRFFEEDPGEVGYELLTKVTTGRVIGEVEKRWAIQGLLTDAAGVGETVWGCLTIADGNFALSFATSADANQQLFTGQAVMADDGRVTLIKDGVDSIMQGYVNLDGDMLVLGYAEDGGLQESPQQGVFVAVPEPASLTLLTIAGVAIPRRRR
ncbi:MAG: hypothetical protein ACOC95_00705 [Planctomycetota bacterium]